MVNISIALFLLFIISASINYALYEKNKLLENKVNIAEKDKEVLNAQIQVLASRDSVDTANSLSTGSF